MAVPTITHNLTTISNADSTTGWVALAGAMISTSDALEGTGGIFIQYKNLGTDGAAFDLTTGGTFNALTNRVYIWVQAPAAFVESFANGGIQVHLASDGLTAETNYKQWNVGGNDVDWVKDGGFRRIVLDANRTEDASGGTFVATAVRWVGIIHNCKATAMIAGTIIDIMHYGSSYEVTGPSYTGNGSTDLDFNDNGGSPDTIVRTSGSWITDGFENGDTIVVSGTTNNNGEYVLTAAPTATDLTVATGSLVSEQNVAGTVRAVVGLQDIVDRDVSAATYLGVVVKNERAASFEINSNLFLGDASGTSSLVFRSASERVVFADQPLLAATRNDLTLKQDAGAVTQFRLGQSVGSGESKVGFSGTVFNRVNTVFGLEPKIDFSTSVNSLAIYGSLFRNIGSSVVFAANTAHEVISTGFSACGQIDLGSVFARDLLFANTQDINGALLWNSSIDIKNSSFFANTTGEAIEHDTWNGAASGTASNTGSETTVLTDTGTTFLTDVAVNDIVYNETDDSYATVTAVDTDTQVTHTALANGTNNYWTTNDAYSFATPIPYTDLVFSGNTVDVNNTTSPANVVAISKAGTSNPTTESGFTVIQGSVTVKITVKDKGGNLIDNVLTGVYKTSDRTELMNELTVSGVAETTYAGSTPVGVEVRCRKASSGATKYINFSSVQTIQSGTGLDLAVTMTVDTKNNATS